MRRTLFPCLLMLSVVAATARASNDARADYPLDTVPRELPPDVRRPRCDRDVLVRYKQTVIGVAWSVLRPALTILIFWFIIELQY